SYTLFTLKIGDFALSHIVSQTIFNLQQCHIDILSIFGIFGFLYKPSSFTVQGDDFCDLRAPLKGLGILSLIV
ncbi:hypothetical protein MTR67_020185, partial [Solanum verrucosum]